MQVDVLGPARVITATGEAVLPGGRSTALLAWLVLRAGRRTDFRWLAGVLWTQPSTTAVPKARMLARGLATVLGPDALVIDTRTVRLVLADDAVDAWRFERLLGDAETYLAAGDRAHAQANIAAALLLWRGDPYPELDRAEPARTPIHRLTERRLWAIEQRIELALAGAEVDYRLVAELRSLVALHPARVRLRGHLAQALYRTDRQIEALDVLRVARQDLGDATGALAQLQQAILRHDPASHD